MQNEESGQDCGNFTGKCISALKAIGTTSVISGICYVYIFGMFCLICLMLL